MATNYEAHVALHLVYIFRILSLKRAAIAENKGVGRRDKRRRSVAEQLETLAEGVEVKEQKEDVKEEEEEEDEDEDEDEDRER
ncbi:Uncharacterized protein DBV15_05329 [Temnothorax longispinosus]|uniref:Uncharacterized protein n=1 Tax=Temnothorax longispinosus TaxID=300112 RepID=A0A4S2L3J0_9HYME|nr:Uncharacterized protein DBV15_05329 [Temnothorax longispinosus]